MVFYHLALNLAAEKIRPQKFTKRRRVLGKAAGAPQFAGEAAERVILEILDRFRKIVEMPALTLGVVGIDPALIVHHTPKRILFDHGEIADDGDQNILDAFVVERAGKVM